MKIYIVGIGPGSRAQLTNRALRAIEESNVVAGYKLYISLVEELLEGKEIIETAMKGEVDRCQQAIDKALEGNTVSVISSGDAGIYGMACIIYELAEGHADLEIETIPGITAASSGGGVLGAPLSHDFAVISLSDLLTDWEVIEKRLKMAAAGDFAMAIYNPSSKKRSDYLSRACEIIMTQGGEKLICGIVRNIDREGQEYQLMTIKELATTPVDMFTTVFIGNSQTKIINGRMVTPRGYKL